METNNTDFKQDSEFDLSRTVNKLAQGFISGFTTINVGDESRNSAEAIAHNIGSALGFMGYIPSRGALGKFAASGVVKSMGLHKFDVFKSLAKYETEPTNLLRVHSVPMAVADKVTHFIKQSEPLQEAANFFQQSMSKSLLDKVQRSSDIVEEGFKMGLASGVGAWQFGIDAMLKSALQGGLEGAGFRAINNFLDIGHIIPEGSPDKAKAGNMLIRGLSNGIYSGLQSGFMGDPTEVQVYHYLLGGIFGVTDQSYETRRANDFIATHIQNKSHTIESDDPKFANFNLRLINVKDIPAFHKEADVVQEELLNQRHLLLGKVFGAKTEAGQVLSNVFGISGIDDKWVDDIGASIEDIGDENVIADKLTESINQRIKRVDIPLVAPNLQDSNDILLRAHTALQAFEDNKLPVNIVNPLIKIANSIVTKAKEAGNTLALEDVSKDIASMTRSAIDDTGTELNMDSFSVFAKRIGDNYKYPFNPDSEDWGKLRQVWKRTAGEKNLIKQEAITYDNDGNIVFEDVSERINDDYNARYGDVSYMDSVLSQFGIGTINVSQINSKKANNVIDAQYEQATKGLDSEASQKIGTSFGDEYKAIGNRNDLSEYLNVKGMNDYILASLMNNKPIVATKKDAGTFIHADRFIIDSDIHNGEIVTSENLGQTQYHPILGDGSTWIEIAKHSKNSDGTWNMDVYKDALKDQLGSDYLSHEVLRNEFVEGITDQSLKDTAAILYDKSTLNNIRLHEVLNGNIDGTGIAFKDQSGREFLKSAMDMNKRGQLFVDRNVSADAGFIISESKDKLPEHLNPEEGLKTMIISAKGLKAEGMNVNNDFADETSLKYKMIDGQMLLKREQNPSNPSSFGLVKGSKNIEWYAADHHLDGVTYLHPTVFEAMRKDMGLEKGTGALKASYVGGTKEEGMFLGKQAIYKATPDMQAAMEEYGVHQFVFSTSAKQTGKRSVLDVNVKDGKWNIEAPSNYVKAEPKYRIPMNFEDGTGGRRMRDEFRGKSTLELIKEGKRTATSRDRSKSYNSQDIKSGDVIEFYSNNGKSKGQSVLVKVTKPPYKLSGVTPEEWSSLEGWDMSGYDKIKNNRYEQFQFELLNESDNSGKPSSFNIPYSWIKQNASSSEHLHDMVSDQYAPVQLATNISDPVAQDHWMKTHVEPSIKGDSYHNDLLKSLWEGKRFIDSQGNKWHGESPDIDRIRMDEVGLQDLINIVRYNGEMPIGSDQHKLYQKAVGEIMKSNIDTPNDADFVSMDDISAAKSMAQQGGQSDRIIKIAMANNALTPAIMDMELVRPYFQQALTNYAHKRAMRPKIKHSAVAVLTAQTPYTIKQHGIVEEGEFMLHGAYKDKMMRWVKVNKDGSLKETKRKFIDAYNDYLDAKSNNASPEIVKQMEDLLTFQVVRVPADSASGTRVLKFKGFTDQDGAGMILHNLDMMQVGGADLDIDKAFFFQDIDHPRDLNGNRPVKDFYADEKQKNQWYQKDSVGNNTWVLTDAKERPELYDSEGNSLFEISPTVHEKSKAGLVSPLFTSKVHLGATMGNKLIGVAANSQRRLQSLYDYLKSGGEIKYDSLGADPVRLPFARSLDKFYALRRGLMNVAVDAANGAGIRLSNKEVDDLLIRSIHDEAIIKPRAEKEKDQVSMSKIIIPTESGGFTFTEFDRALYGKDSDGNTMPFDTWMESIRDGASINLDNIYYKSAKYLAGLEYEPRKQFVLPEYTGRVLTSAIRFINENLNAAKIGSELRSIKQELDVLLAKNTAWNKERVKELQLKRAELQFRRSILDAVKSNSLSEKGLLEIGESGEPVLVEKLRKGDKLDLDIDLSENFNSIVQDAMATAASIPALYTSAQYAKASILKLFPKMDKSKATMRLQSVLDDVATLKDAWTKEQWSDRGDKAQIIKRLNRTDETVSSLSKKMFGDDQHSFDDIVKATRDRLSTDEEKTFFDTAFLSSIYPNRNKDKTQFNSFVERGSMSRQEALAEYHRTGLSPIGFKQTSVHDKSLRYWLEMYNAVNQSRGVRMVKTADGSEVKFSEVYRNLFKDAPVLDKDGNVTLKVPMSTEELDVQFKDNPLVDERLKPNPLLNYGEQTKIMRQYEKRVKVAQPSEYGRNLMFSESHAVNMDASTEQGRKNIRIVDTLQSLFKNHPEYAKVMDSIFESVTGVHPNIATYDDVNRFINEADKMLNKTGSKSYKYWMDFLDMDSLGKKAADHSLTEMVRPVVFPDGSIVNKEVYALHSTFTKTANTFRAIQANESTGIEENVHVIDYLNRNMNALGSEKYELFHLATVKRESSIEHTFSKDGKKFTSFYKDRLKDHEERFKKVIDSGKTYLWTNHNGSTERIGGMEVIKRINNDMTSLLQSVYSRHIRNDDVWNKYTENNTKDAFEVLAGWMNYADKTGSFPNDITTELMDWVLHDYRQIGKAQRITSLINEFKQNKKGIGLKYLNETKGFLEAKKKQLEGQPIPSVLNTPLNEIGFNEVKMYLRESEAGFERPEPVPFDTYFPHLNYDPVKAKEYFNRVRDHLNDKSEELSEYELRLLRHGINSGYVDDDGIAENVIQQLQEVRNGGDDLLTVKAFKAGNQQSRGSSPIDGYDTSLNALLEYMNRQVKGKYNFVRALSGDYYVRDFENREPFGSDSKKWGDRLSMFVQSSMNRSPVFTQEMLEQRGWKDNPVWKFMGIPIADQAVEEALKKWKPKWYEEKTKYNPNEVNTWIRNMAGVEGKVEFLSLLTNPKSMVNNLFGGTIQTITHTGLRHWRNAGNIKWLQRHLNDSTLSKWTSDDWDRFVEQSGGMDSFYTDLFGIGRDADVRKGFGLLAEKVKMSGKIGTYVRNELKNDPQIRELLKSALDRGIDIGKVTQQVIEYKLRKRSWIAHYLKGREALNANGIFSPEHDDTLLIEMANKGVAASQFLYDNISKPAFMQSAVGQVLTRFQSWAYNSLKVKADVLSEANRYGFQKGTESFERFDRMMRVDASILALASLFPISMFGSAVAPPYNYLTDIAGLIYGDEQDEEGNDKTFGQKIRDIIANPQNFAPTALVTPPITRFVLDPVRALFTGEWDRFLDYHLWTWFPFGMPARTAYKTVVNPTFAVETVTGFPIVQLARNLQNTREDEPLES